MISNIAPVEADEMVSKYQKLNLKFVRCDWTHEEVLKRAGVLDARTVIALPDDSLDDTLKMDELTILATLTIKSLNPKVRLMAHIKRRDNKGFLQRANSDMLKLTTALFVA